MKKNSKENIILPRLSYEKNNNYNLDIRNQKQYHKPKLKRIHYAPIITSSRLQNQYVMIQSCIENRNYQEIEDQIKQNKIRRYLKGQIQQDQEKIQNSLIGRQAQLNYYQHYKKLDKIQQRQSIGTRSQSIFTSILSKSQSLDVLPCCLGLVKTRGQSSILNVNRYKLGDKYISALSAGLKQAKLIQSCLVSNNRLTNIGLNQLMNNISLDVSKIDLSHNKIRNINQKLLTHITGNQSRLQILNLQNNLLGDNSLQSICLASSYSKHLKYLNVRKNMLTNQSSDSIAQLLSKTQVLQQLYIGMNKIYNKGAQKIIDSLTNNHTVKVFDYSLNKLGDTKISCANSISNCFKKNKTLIHVDFSSNNFSQNQSKIISQGLLLNKKIYGIHFRGNYGYIDSKGFLIIKQKVNTTLHSITDIQIDSYQINFRRPQLTFQPELFKNVCWICQGWYQQEFKFNVPIECIEEKKLVYIHFDFELYEPRLINLTDKHVKYRTMVPPKKYRYFFTCNRQQFLDSHGGQIFIYQMPQTYKYQMYCSQYEFTVSKVSCRTGKCKKIVNPWDELIVTVLPRIVGLVTKREKIAWTYKDSLWSKQWKLQDQELTKKCFQKDWKNSKITNLVKNQNEQERIKDTLSQNYKIIKQIYRHYSSWSPFGDVWAVSNNAFTQFCHFAKIVSKQTPLKIIDLTFITTNSMSGADWKGNQLVPQRGLVRFQFMQSLVRLSQQKYKKNGICDTIIDSINYLLKDHIVPLVNQFASQKWRLQKYFIEQNDILIKKYRPIFSQIYKKNSKMKVRPGQKSFMCLAQFKSIMERIGMTANNIIERDIFLSFNCSMMTQVDQLQKQRFMKMSQIQFIQAVARVAYLLPKNCRIEPQSTQPIQFYMKLEWLINELKNNLCSDDLKLQYPNLQKSIFTQIDQDN